MVLAITLGVSSLTAIWPLIRPRPIGALLLALLVAVIGIRSIEYAPMYAASVRNINQLQVALGRWMKQRLPTGSRVAVNDIGAVAYFSGHEILDLEGLVTPEALAYARPVRGIGSTTETRPDYIAIFPARYPDIASRPDLFHEVYRISIAGNVISAGDTIVVYRTPWTRQPLLPEARLRE